MALLLVTPGAEPLVGRWRADHDWAAESGVPAHVTVRLPFLPPARWHEAEHSDVLPRLLPADVTLARLEDRPGALVIVAEPDGELRRITAAVGEEWPSLPPHKGGRADLAYHVTVVRTPDADVRAEASVAIAPHLPLRVRGTAFVAAHGSPEKGAVHAVVATAPTS